MASPSLSPLALPPTKELIAKRQDEEAKMGFAPLTTVVLAGVGAGVMVWLLPLPLLLLNMLVGLLSGARGASFGRLLLPLMVSPTSRFWLLVTATTGLMSALARRWSVRNGHYWHVAWPQSGTLRLGLDDLVALSAGTLLLWWALVCSGAGRLMYWLMLAPAPGLLLHALWQAFYAPIIRRVGRVSDLERVEMLMLTLRSDPNVRRACRILRHTLDTETGVLEITISAESAQAESYLRQLLNHLNVSELAVRQVRITQQDA
ncbi:MAG: hypothetical protein ACOX4G_07330 [Limnochordia bacterium]|jgi:hypothetical protein